MRILEMSHLASTKQKHSADDNCFKKLSANVAYMSGWVLCPVCQH